MSDIGNSTHVEFQKQVAGTLELAAIGLAVIIITLLTILERNQKGERPGVVSPVDLISDDNFTYAYAAAFGCTSSFMLYLIESLESGSLNVSEWLKIPFWLALVVVASLKFYPIFALIRNKCIVLRTVLGIFYVGYLFSALIYELIQVKIENNDTTSIIISVPILICYLILLGHFVYRAVEYLRTRNGYSDTLALIIIPHIMVLRLYPIFVDCWIPEFLNTRQQIFPWCSGRELLQEYFDMMPRNYCPERRYVKWLLQCKTNREIHVPVPNTNIYSRMRSYKIDMRRKLDINTPLKSSPRVIATFVVSCVMLLQMGITFCMQYQTLRAIAISYAKENFVNATLYQQIEIFTEVINVSFYISFGLSTIIIGTYIVLIYGSYRRDILKMYHGDFSFLPKKVQRLHNKEFVAASLRYSGTQIAFIFWCYIVLFVAILLLCLMLAYLLILPLMGMVPDGFLVVVKTLIPALAATYIFHWCQSALVNRYFMQDHKVRSHKGDLQHVIALKNRKMFDVLNYFMFFFHVIMGFFDSLSRIILGAVIGILSLARMDKSLLPRGYEHLDNGYTTYVGLLMLELYHRNPVLLVFCEELLDNLSKQNESSREPPLENPADDHIGYQRQVTDSLTTLRRRQVKNRWLKLYTLINNPCLVHKARNKYNHRVCLNGRTDFHADSKA